MTGNNSTDRVLEPDRLKEIYLFSAFDAAQLETMAQATGRISLAQGQRLFDQGDEIRRFFYVERGQIKLYRLAADGGEKVVDIIGSGQTFAEAVVFMERTSGYPVNSAAIEPSELLGFDAPAFLSLLRQSNESCLRLMAVMTRRLRWQLNEIDRLTLHDATSRFVSYILAPGPGDIGNGKRIELNAPKNVLASRLSIQPETFSRILSRLSAAGAIKVDRQAITLLDVEQLRTQLHAD